MPHVIVKFYPERDPAETQAMAAEVATALHQTMGFRVQDVSVAIEVVEKADWMSSVYARDIAGDDVRLVKWPGYGPLARPQ